MGWAFFFGVFIVAAIVFLVATVQFITSILGLFSLALLISGVIRLIVCFLAKEKDILSILCLVISFGILIVYVVGCVINGTEINIFRFFFPSFLF